jgi:DNA polymerase III epsilon subunit-like protein
MYVYGDSDVEFLKATLPNAKSEAAILITSIMIATIKDYSIEVAKYFHGTTSLIKAFNYLKSLEDKQKHNALEDAMMLAEVYSKTLCAEPLEANPFATTTPTECNYNFPVGKFYCKSTGKNAKEREFANIHDAMEWIIEHKIGQNERPNVRRDKMAVKIMIAIKKKKTYMQYKWRREK